MAAQYSRTITTPGQSRGGRWAYRAGRYCSFASLMAASKVVTIRTVRRAIVPSSPPARMSVCAAECVRGEPAASATGFLFKTRQLTQPVRQIQNSLAPMETIARGAHLREYE